MRHSRLHLPCVLLGHAALFVWAARAWIAGPFRGRGVIDGQEVLLLAQTGSAGAFETKSPLYPFLLGRLLELGGDTAWTVALAGLATSLALLLVVTALARKLGGPRAALVAGSLYALSGSTLAFGVQPLDTLFSTLLLFAGAILAEDRERRGRALAGGLLLGAAPFARSTLALAVLPLLARALWRRSPAAAGIPLAALVLGLFFGARSLPEGGALNLRLGNDPARPGFTDLRPGPRYDRLRWEAVLEQPDTRPLEPTSRWHLRLLGRAIAADPVGFAANLGRKAYLALHRTEIVASADFRHGLERFPLAPLLLQSFALVAPLALLGLRRRAPPVLILPLAGILLANVLLVTAARYRFPALPFLCVAASLAITPWPSRRELLALGLAAALLVPNLSGARLVAPGDGLVQEGYLELAAEPGSAAAIDVLRRAVLAGDDPRAGYLLGLACEQAGFARGDPGLLDEAERAYAGALAREPVHPHAAENRVALALRRGDLEGAEALARALLEVPYAGKVRLNLAALPGVSPAEARELAREGHALLALRLAAQGAPEATEHALEALRLGSRDARLAGLAGVSTPSAGGERR